MTVDYSKVTNVEWTPEQLAEHLRRIGADKVPAKPKTNTSITAPQQHQGSSHYSRRGGEW
ncbi:hypothetical protein [Paenibacillus agri]|uniref:Uncharacterized protein n=1 Tax=Paenibacillus agri TaxID=2744309 RepID=A0A850ESB3_9BACL|nr:hypothetical protein [Paenibacillus agri]NUU62680.1 hypothetical protein [Paenibacillus agri]